MYESYSKKVWLKKTVDYKLKFKNNHESSLNPEDRFRSRRHIPIEDGLHLDLPQRTSHSNRDEVHSWFRSFIHFSLGFIAIDAPTRIRENFDKKSSGVPAYQIFFGDPENSKWDLFWAV